MVERWLDGYDGLKEVERAAGEFMEGTREKELSELERLLVGEERQRVVVVQGPFGIGKSCLLAQLCAKGGLLKEHRASGWLRNSLLRPLSQRKKGRLLVGAAHFLLLSDNDDEKSKSLSVCLYSIAHQLCSIVSGLREELEKIQDELETVDDLKTLFRKVLVTPLQRVSKMDGVVVVLDGMEALPSVERQVLLEVLCEHWEREMPSWISVVVSSRPVRKELEAFKTIKMEYESEENKKDLEVYLKKRLEPVVVEREVDLSESVKYVIRRAKGMFLYAREVTTQVVLEKEPHSLMVLDVCVIVEQAEKEGCGLDVNTDTDAKAQERSAEALDRFGQSPVKAINEWVEKSNEKTRENLAAFLSDGARNIRWWIDKLKEVTTPGEKRLAAKALAGTVRLHFMLVLGSDSSDPRLDKEKTLQYINERLASGALLQEDDFGDLLEVPKWL